MLRLEARRRLVDALDAKTYRPEMREMEKVLVLQILDQSWMEHLRTMDHLRSLGRAPGYAQVDPKVEYKREGMKIIRGDVVGGLRQGDRPRLPDGAARPRLPVLSRLAMAARPGPGDPPGARPPEPAAVPPVEESGPSRKPAIAASQQNGETKREPVRNLGKKVGRNDPCPCGSGKKFKACCMKKEGGPPTRSEVPDGFRNLSEMNRHLTPTRRIREGFFALPSRQIGVIGLRALGRFRFGRVSRTSPIEVKHDGR